MTDHLTLAFEILARNHRTTTYTVHTNNVPSGTLQQPNGAFDVILDAADRNLEPDITFTAMYRLPRHGWPIQYRNGFWHVECDDHPDEVLADRDLLVAAEIVAGHIEEHHQ